MAGPAHAVVYPRIGLVGNPSDGYGGKIIAATFRNFAVEMSPGPDPNPNPAQRLTDAAARRFARYCKSQDIAPPEKTTLHLETTIPRQVGLAGSSAIIIAALRTLAARSGVRLDNDTLIDMALKTETEELQIAAGLMDRTVQVLEGVLFFDCAADSVSASARRIDPAALPELYLAYNETLARDSGAIHSGVRARYDAGDPKVHRTMKELSDLAQEAFDLLEAGRGAELGPVMDRNYDLRAGIFAIDEKYDEMVRVPRAAGARAKFAGSGGAVVGTYKDETMLERLRQDFAEIGATVIVPRIS